MLPATVVNLGWFPSRPSHPKMPCSLGSGSGIVVFPISAMVLPPIHVKELPIILTLRAYPLTVTALESSRVKLHPSIFAAGTAQRAPDTSIHCRSPPRHSPQMHRGRSRGQGSDLGQMQSSCENIICPGENMYCVYRELIQSSGIFHYLFEKNCLFSNRLSLLVHRDSEWKS